MTRVLIALGSSIDKETNIPRAIEALRSHHAIALLAVSQVYASAALDSDGRIAGQPSFHNAAVLVETSLPAAQLRQILRAIEAEQGRMRTDDKFAPRPIDLDIAMLGQEVLSLDGKQIPDPDIVRFPHIAVPIAELCPQWIHPQLGVTLREIAEDFCINEMEIVHYDNASAV